MATLTRGTLDAFARTWYLLSAEDVRGLLYRHLSFAYADLRYVVSNGDHIETRDGVPVDADTYQQDIKETLVAMGFTGPAKIELARQAAALLNEALETTNGYTEYSQVSGVAHGHQAAVSMYLRTDIEDGIPVGLRLPRILAIDYGYQILGAAVTVINSFMDVSAVELVPHGERWESAATLANQAMRRLKTGT